MIKKALVAGALVLAGSSAMAADVGVAGSFSKGRTHFVLTAGSGSAFDETYLVLGLGATYYLLDGLGAGLHYESWSGGDPDMTKLTASLQYVFHQMQVAKPYVGTFFRRTNIDGLADLDSIGARGGVYFGVGRNAYLGVGGVYESYLDCSKSVYRSCDSTYGEVSLTFAF
jgi:opacity protein-like surface antigen